MCELHVLCDCNQRIEEVVNKYKRKMANLNLTYPQGTAHAHGQLLIKSYTSCSV